MCPNADTVGLHGWTAVPVDADAIFEGKPYLNEPTPVSLSDITWPSDDPIVAKVQEYAKEKLPIETYNHSMRVFHWGKLYPLIIILILILLSPHLVLKAN